MWRNTFLSISETVNSFCLYVPGMVHLRLAVVLAKDQNFLFTCSSLLEFDFLRSKCASMSELIYFIYFLFFTELLSFLLSAKCCPNYHQTTDLRNKDLLI